MNGARLPRGPSRVAEWRPDPAVRGGDQMLSGPPGISPRSATTSPSALAQVARLPHLWTAARGTRARRPTARALPKTPARRGRHSGAPGRPAIAWRHAVNTVSSPDCTRSGRRPVGRAMGRRGTLPPSHDRPTFVLTPGRTAFRITTSFVRDRRENAQGREVLGVSYDGAMRRDGGGPGRRQSGGGWA